MKSIMKPTVFMLAAGLLAVSNSSRAEEKRPLVTLTGQLKSQFSVELNSNDMRRIADELQSLEKLQPVEININDLFSPGDEEAIREAASHMGHKILRASEIIIDLKAIVYRLAALDRVVTNKTDRSNLRSTFNEKFQRQYTRLLSTFALSEEALFDALKKCRSEICVTQIGILQRNAFDFGWHLNKRQKVASGNFSALFKASAVGAYEAVKRNGTSDTDYKNSVQAVSAALASAVTESGNPAEEAILAALREPVLEDLGLSIPSLDKSVFKTEAKALDDTLKRFYRWIVLGEESKPEPQNKEELELRRADVLFCHSELHNEADWHLGIYGKGNFECTSARTGQSHYATIHTFGPGLYIAASIFTLTILSPASIPLKGTWVGVQASAGAAVGATTAVFAGKYGSTMLLTGLSFSLGAQAGIAAVTLKD